MNNDKRPITKGQRIAAIVVVIMLVALYIVTFVLAITAKPGANGMFLASIICTILIPTVLYVTMWLMRMFNDRKNKNDEL